MTTLSDLLTRLRRRREPPPEPTDRAWSERFPREEDHCFEFRRGPAEGDCQTDGHYLCDGCSLMDPYIHYHRVFEHAPHPWLSRAEVIEALTLPLLPQRLRGGA